MLLRELIMERMTQLGDTATKKSRKLENYWFWITRDSNNLIYYRTASLHKGQQTYVPPGNGVSNISISKIQSEQKISHSPLPNWVKFKFAARDTSGMYIYFGNVTQFAQMDAKTDVVWLQKVVNAVKILLWMLEVIVFQRVQLVTLNILIISQYKFNIKNYKGCANGVCEKNNTCHCNEGFVLVSNGKFCVPKCSGCGVNENCTAPGVCECMRGHVFSTETHKCEPTCSEPCGNGVCVGNDICTCNEGYVFVNGKCQLYCPG